MAPKTHLTWLLLLTGGLLSAQETNFNESILFNSDRTYIQFMEGIVPRRGPNQDGVQKLWFMEAQISPAYFARLGKQSRFGLLLSPKLIIRLADRESFPIKTPSFMPHLTLYHAVDMPFLTKNKATRWLFTPDHKTLFTYKFSHHSNGQKDPFLIPGTRRINFDTGNFTTDYLELGFIWVSANPERKGLTFNGRFAFEQHFEFDREPLMREIYYYNRYTFENMLFIGKSFRLSTNVSYMTGKGRFENKALIDAFLSYRLFQDKTDFSLFVRGYHGPDYYNIRYVNTQRYIAFGMMATPAGTPLFRW